MLKLILLLAILPMLAISVFAQCEEDISIDIETDITVKSGSPLHFLGKTVVISGNVTPVIGDTPITLQLFLYNKLINVIEITVAQDGTYSYTLFAENTFKTKTGKYLVRVSYGDGNIAETNFWYLPFRL